MALAVLALLPTAATPDAAAYVLNYVVPDVRQAAPGGTVTACPQRMRMPPRFDGILGRTWATLLGTSPVTIRTLSQNPDGRLNEIEASIGRAFDAWTAVAGSDMSNAAPPPLGRVAAISACFPDGWLAVCTRQTDPAFAFGVLAFTRVTVADGFSAQLGSNPPLPTFPGQILDADVLLRPNDVSVRFATPEALASNPAAYDLDSVLTHEIGHVFGLGHSGVWRAIMFPFVPSPGTFVGPRGTALTPDAPLGKDDRTAMRALYPDPFDSLHAGSISGRVLPANPLLLAGDAAAPSGMYGAQVVAVDDATGAVVAAAISGWTCSDPGPPVFDGSYRIERLPALPGQSYRLHAEPLDGPLTAPDAFGQVTLCRNQIADPGWPPSLSCVTPRAQTGFSTRARPGP